MVHELLRNLVKDIRIEFRNPSGFLTSISFAAIATIAISMVARSYPFTPLVQAILLWIIMFFAAMNSLLHIFIREYDRGTDQFLKLHASPGVIYGAKLLFNAVFFMMLQIVIAVLGVAFLQIEVNSPIAFIIIIIAGGIAISGTSTILSAMAAKSGGRGSLFTIISFPVLLPVLWVAISATEKGLVQVGYNDMGSVIFLLAFSGLIIALSFLLIRFVWLDE